MEKELEEELRQHEEFIKEAIRLLESTEKDALANYLDKLDFETIKVLQTIMYIGRDSTYKLNDGSYDYDYTRNHLHKKGWKNPKAIEVEQFVSKYPLAEYLRKGCMKIGYDIF